jgi:uncharacterized RDD family membrane protein YckC
MENTVIDNVTQQVIEESPYNKKPRFLARILSGLVDIFLVFIVGFGLFQIEMATSISDGYRQYRNSIITTQDTTKLETGVGHKLYENEETYSNYSQYNHYTEADSASEHYGQKYVVVNNQDITKEAKQNYTSALSNNGVYQSNIVTFRAIYFGLLMMAAGITELILVFLVPLFNKRRATIGRFVALTSLISNKEVEAKWWQLLIRFLFVLLIETALPLFYLSEFATLLIVGTVNIAVVLISRKTGRTLRDYVSLTRIIDKSSYKSITEQ